MVRASAIRTRRKLVLPRTPTQGKYIEAIRKQRAGLRHRPGRHRARPILRWPVRPRRLMNGEVDRIVLSRPAVEAGERLGFLPGDMKEKVDPYLRPLYDALYDMMPAALVAKGHGREPDRDRAARLHARPHAVVGLRHPGRSAEHHAAADEDVPDPPRRGQPHGGDRRSHPGRPAERDRPRDLPMRWPRSRAWTASPRFTSPMPTSCAMRWSAVSSRPMTRRQQSRTANDVSRSMSRRQAGLSSPVSRSWRQRPALPFSRLQGKRPDDYDVSRSSSSSDEAVRALNAAWRGKDNATNVLSFPAEDMPLPKGEPHPLGDIVLAHGVVVPGSRRTGQDIAGSCRTPYDPRASAPARS